MSYSLCNWPGKTCRKWIKTFFLIRGRVVFCKCIVYPLITKHLQWYFSVGEGRKYRLCRRIPGRSNTFSPRWIPHISGCFIIGQIFSFIVCIWLNLTIITENFCYFIFCFYFSRGDGQGRWLYLPNAWCMSPGINTFSIAVPISQPNPLFIVSRLKLIDFDQHL